MRRLIIAIRLALRGRSIAKRLAQGDGRCRSIAIGKALGDLRCRSFAIGIAQGDLCVSGSVATVTFALDVKNGLVTEVIVRQTFLLKLC